jgi:hypothetical protein
MSQGFPSPQELDAQSKIQISRWIDIESQECREIDENYSFTKQMIRTLHDQEPQYLFTDQNGRLWGKGVDQRYYPFHMEYKGKLIGYRLSKKASN